MKLAELLGLGSRLSLRPGARTVTARGAIALCHKLTSDESEASRTRLATEALAAYQSLDGPNRLEFFETLIREFSPDPEAVGQAGDAYRRNPSPSNLVQLQNVVESPRNELFGRLNLAPEGTGVLVKMRAEALRESENSPKLKPIATDLAHLFTSWFNRGFLVLRRIDWRTSAVILEKLIQYEAVHQIHGWHDLRRRLEADRRCYAFFHPALADEPIIFVEAALTRSMSDNLQALFDPDLPVLDAGEAEWAIFYAITNCQDGLRGVPFGSFLIKQVVEDLSKELPHIKRFATISPVPGFRKWLAQKAGGAESDRKLAPLARVLAKIENTPWASDAAARADLQRYLLPLGAYYLLNARENGDALDPVARFHLKNGARLERINWPGDTSVTGVDRSAGLTANYVYRIPDIERNYELYTREHKVACSREVEALAKRFIPPTGF